MVSQHDFPNAPPEWSVTDANIIAENEDLELTENHWQVIKAIQSYAAGNKEYDINVRELLDALDEKFHYLGGKKFLYKILPKGPVAQGCRLAGIHPPAGSTDLGFGSVQ